MRLANGQLLFGTLVALAMASTAEGGVLELFFGPKDEAEEAEIEYPDGAGWFLDEDEFELGREGFRCLEQMAGAENENKWGQNLMRPISRVMLQAYGAAGIRKLCGSELRARMIQKARSGDQRKQRERNLRKAAPPSSSNATMSERRNAGCSSWPARYATASTYDSFARDHLSDYLNGDDLTQRTNAVKTFTLQDQVATTKMARTVLTRCTRLWSSANQFISIPDIPIVNQEAISQAVQTFVCDLPLTYTDVVMLRLQRDQELVHFHNELVASAEAGAMYQDTKTLMAELCERDSVTERVLDDIDVIKKELNRR